MSSKKVDFILPAEIAAGATSGILLGEFNNWDFNKGVALKLQKDGSLKASITLESGSYEYRYLLNDGRWVNDNQAADYKHISEFAIENCVVNVSVEALEAPKAKASKVTTATTAEKPAKAAKTTTTKAVATENKKAEKPAKATTKAKVAEATPAKADDLTIVEGIGKKIAELLIADGIATFDALAKSSTKLLQTILDKGGKRFSMHSPETWAKQAKLAAAGEWAKLEKLKGELIGGKKK